MLDGVQDPEGLLPPSPGVPDPIPIVPWDEDDDDLGDYGDRGGDLLEQYGQHADGGEECLALHVCWKKQRQYLDDDAELESAGYGSRLVEEVEWEVLRACRGSADLVVDLPRDMPPPMDADMNIGDDEAELREKKALKKEDGDKAGSILARAREERLAKAAKQAALAAQRLAAAQKRKELADRHGASKAAPRSPRSPRSPKPGLETEGLEVTNGENSPRKRAARGDDSSDDADSILDGDDDATQPTPTEAVPAKPAPKPSPEKPPNAAHAKAAPPNAKAVAVTTFEFN